MLRYIKTAIFTPKEIYIARNMKGLRFFFYYAFLVLIIAFSVLGQIAPLLQQLSEDSQEIAEALPDFVVENNRLTTEEDSFIYQTTTTLFFFDSDAEITSETIDRNMDRLSASLAIGLLEQELYLNIDGVGRPLSYNQLDGMNQDFLRLLFEELSRFSFLTIVLTFAIIYIGLFFQTFMEMIILFLFANIVSILMRSRLRFTQSARMALVASTMPILLISLTNIFQFSNPYQYEMRVLFSLVLFVLSTLEMKKRRRQELEQKKKEIEKQRKSKE